MILSTYEISIFQETKDKMKNENHSTEVMEFNNSLTEDPGMNANEKVEETTTNDVLNTTTDQNHPR